MRFHLVLFLVVIALGACSAPEPPAASLQAPPGGAAFIENVGQWDAEIRYALVGDRRVAILDGASVVHSSTAGSARFDFEGGAIRAESRQGDELDSAFHFIRGSDRSDWSTGVAGFEDVLFEDVYPGVDIGFATVDGRLKYDVIVDPGSDPDAVVVRCRGVDSISIDEHGDLVVQSVIGEIRQPRPVTWQVLPDGEREPVACEYRVIDDERFGFDTSAWDRRGQLVIDPELEYATYLGGAEGADLCMATMFAPNGDMIVIGQARSLDFPVTPGAFDTTHEGDESFFFDGDVYVTRFGAMRGELKYSTFIGGDQNDSVQAGVVRPDGAVLLAGSTGSEDYPTTPGAYRRTYAITEGFVTCLTPDGSDLVFSTFLGGTSSDYVESVAFGPDGSTVLTGDTQSDDFPTTPGAYDVELEGLCDGFVTRVSPDGSSLMWSTLIGGELSEFMRAIGIGPSGDVVVGGSTNGPSLESTPGAIMDSSQGGDFIARFSSMGALEYLTYIAPATDSTVIRDIEVSDDGEAIVLGHTFSTFPTTPGAFQPDNFGSQDVFIARINSEGSGYVYSTFLGAGGLDCAETVSVDRAGIVTLVGATLATAFPTTEGAYQETEINGPFGRDVFVSRLAPDGDRLFYSTYLHGDAGELGVLVGSPESVGVGVDPTGDALVGARTTSPFMIVTPSAFDPTYNDLSDTYIARLDMTPTGTRKIGASTPGCDGPLMIGVTAMPSVGRDEFGFFCTNAPRNSSAGFLIAGSAPLTSPLHVGRTAIWVDVSSPMIIPVSSNENGYSELPLRIPNDAALAGTRAAVQYIWPTACGPASFSASNAMALIIQP